MGDPNIPDDHLDRYVLAMEREMRVFEAQLENARAEAAQALRHRLILRVAIEEAIQALRDDAVAAGLKQALAATTIWKEV